MTIEASGAEALSQEQKKAIALKIRALLAKTTEAGCTEAEALMAAHKAQELLAKYQLNLSEIDLREEGTDETATPNDPISYSLAMQVANFCEVKVWTNGDKIRFLGLKSDAFFAEWLMLALSAFVKRKALDYSLERNVLQKDIMDFRAGAIDRINARLRDEVKAREAERASGRGRELMVVKGHLITEAWAKKNLTLGASRGGGVKGNRASQAYADGHAVAGQARFARPVARDEFEQRVLTNGAKK